MKQQQSTLRTFVWMHDELPAFHAVYLVLTFLTAILFNFGVFALLIASHMALDFVKYREVQQFSLSQTYLAMFRESLVDIALLTLGVMLSVYLRHAGVVMFVSGLVRAETTIFRGISMFLTKLEILYHALGVFSNVHYHIFLAPVQVGKLSMTEKVALIVIIISLGLLLGAESLLQMSHDTYWKLLADQLVPWRM